MRLAFPSYRQDGGRQLAGIYAYRRKQMRPGNFSPLSLVQSFIYLPDFNLKEIRDRPIKLKYLTANNAINKKSL